MSFTILGEIKPESNIVYDSSFGLSVNKQPRPLQPLLTFLGIMVQTREGNL